MKKTKWLIRKRNADYEALCRTFQISPVCARVLRNRGLITADDFQSYLYGDLNDLSDPRKLRNAAKTAALLEEIIKERRRIRIIGDYDVDGICATAILLYGIREAGGNPDYVIPDRIADGYGMNMNLVTKAIEDGIEVLITCDNGIAAIDQIRAAKEAGMTVIVTDHHLPPASHDIESVPGTGDMACVLPEADVIVDPAVPGETYPFPGMCGAVAAWKVMQLLTHDRMEKVLPLAARAPVCDVMELTGENRIIVRSGLEKMKQLSSGGLYELIRHCQLSFANLSVYDLGFRIGPCLNAGGRLDTAMKCIRLLFAEPGDDAEMTAKELVMLNEQRKAMTEEQTRAAFEMIENSTLTADRILVIYLPECHQSLAGIIAGRIREAYAHPAIVLTKSNEDNILKGSGRSIDEWHIHDALEKCSELLIQFGGHPMAAGLTMREDNLEELRNRLNRDCDLDDDAFCDTKLIDLELPFSQLSLKLAEEINMLEPFGKGNERPVFVTRSVRLSYGRVMGIRKNVLRFTASDPAGIRYPAVWFGDTENFLNDCRACFSDQTVDSMMNGKGCIRVNLLYTLKINEYNGIRSLQLLIVDWKKSE